MEKAPGRLEMAERNLLTEPASTVEAMAQVEGPAWMERQERMEKGNVTVGEWDSGLANAFERLQAGKSATVYGHGGINRWFVEPDGSISFSESHAQSPEHIEKARELGFAIVP